MLLLPLYSSHFHKLLPVLQVSGTAQSQPYYDELLCPHSPWLFPGSCSWLYAGDSSVSSRLEPRRDSSGKPICELCPRRLVEVKGKLYNHGPGKMCQRCHNRQKHPVHTGSASARAAASMPSRKRRAASDPGEAQPARSRTRPPALTRRISPLQPTSTTKKQRTTRLDDAVARLLDETHARRMSAQAASTSSALFSPAEGLAAAEEAEWAARTPAQWARRHYLQHVAPRCDRCNFPRTGRKGWNANTGCHTDQNCNLYRWRVIDAFC